jgi:carboxymethylenebutenolidase
MTAETLVLPTADGPAPAVLAEPEGPARGGVVVVHEAFGLTDHIADVCSRFARAGWRAVAPDLFHREGSPVFDYADIASAMAIVNELNGTDIMTDIDAAVVALSEEGTAVDRCAVVGFCLGGSIAFQAAVARPFGAAVTFYGGGITRRRFGEPTQLDVAVRLQTPWLGLYGDQDASIPVDEVEQLRTAAKRAPVPTEIVRYPDAGHGFHNDARATAYQPESARDAWSRTLTWFDSHVPR